MELLLTNNNLHQKYSKKAFRRAEQLKKNKIIKKWEDLIEQI
ncbi:MULTISPECIES: hypothetical protein [Halanaerobium]|jgi:hypothetical protein|uniref:Uncharacterized protein n=1 Tax=Halanaerobium congolense TaxID=54121 RepID=A0A1M7JU90_9FIRM|nr:MULTISPECIES: hypothetical protein [Halanaerobium]KXS47544.1 MAG: hypothetical protein AWL62_2589 [Halanaerobium sp. T82-1]PTX16249.1 hypothetical protein C7953_0954 [Halanaerobium congolense]PUU87349.1 MAG: hypothetical protein CI949_3603 [Halanaerobium sp.]PUU87613.1 MAG: hypothetical protein CI948_2562 [Halanaerobium sp.]TDS31537.1 hypothetical protein BY453_11111 [Halanaerobium congolense]